MSTSSAQMGDNRRTEPADWVDRHGDALFRYALLRVGDRMLAEDLVQDTLLAAMHGAAAFQQRSTERTWLVGILRHKVLDHFRRVSREKDFAHCLDEPEAQAVEAFDEQGRWRTEINHWDMPERSLERAEFWLVFNDCVSRLPHNLKTPFALRELEGLDGDLLADVLHTSKNNLWVMLSRARARLRSCLEQRWFLGS